MSKKGIILGYVFFVAVAILFYFLFQKDFLKTSSEISPETPLETSAENLINPEEKILTIEQGEGLKEIGEKLKEQGFIKNNLLFKAYVLLSRVKNDFWPGEYHLTTNISLKDLIKTLTGTPLAPEKTITIIEGMTNKELKEVLERESLITDDFFSALEEVSQDETLLAKYEFLESADNAGQDKEARLQGYLFPDTYRFYQETTSVAVIEKMLDNFNEKLDSEMRKEIAESGKTIYEMITMASLIEKEAALDQDRRLVGDVFWRRLKEGWALESCATVNYILGSPKERLTYDDTRTTSLYNTYLHQGLPPGPINNPSLSSIKAAIEPLKNDYCCFLSTDEGKIIFSKTITEHNRNKEIYLTP